MFRAIIVGKDWHHKGGNIAMTLLSHSTSGESIPVAYVGALPPFPINPQWVITHGMLDKSEPTND